MENIDPNIMSIIINNNKNAFIQKNNNIYNYMTSLKPKLLSASHYKAEQKKWTKATAKQELMKLIINGKVETEKRKSENIVSVNLQGEQFLFNLSKNEVTNKLSKTIFTSLYKNRDVNVSNYKKKKAEQQRVDAAKSISAKLKMLKLRKDFNEKRIVDNVEVDAARVGRPIKSGAKQTTGQPISSTTLNLKLNPALEGLPNSEEGEIVEVENESINPEQVHPDSVFENVSTRIKGLAQEMINKQLTKTPNIKVELVLTYTLYRLKLVGQETLDSYYEYEQATRYARTGAVVTNRGNFKSRVEELMNKISKNVYKPSGIGSDWKIKQFLKLEVIAYKNRTANGSSYIALPDKFNNPRSGLINIKNEDNQCFKWCMKYHKSTKDKNSNRISVLKNVDCGYDYSSISYPASFDDIAVFEKINNEAIFVYTLNDEDKAVLSREGNFDICHKNKGMRVNLLLISNNKISHYVYIKDIAKLTHNSACHRTCSVSDKNHCPGCNKFFDKDEFLKHYEACFKIREEGTQIVMPQPGDTIEFKNHKNKIVRPFVIYADMECTLNKTGDFRKVSRHMPNSCAYRFVCTFDPSRNFYKEFKGETCINEMLTDLLNLSESCIKEMQHNEKMIMTYNDKKAFEDATCCHICGGCFEDEKCKVRDHDHLTGKYRGAAHIKCNINYFANRFVPVVFHNLRGYDGHFIIKEMYNLGQKCNDIMPVAQNSEKFMSFKIDKLKFIDSLLFMNSSLEKLAENLIDETHEDKYNKFYNMKDSFGEHMELICRKGIYPYEWFDDIEKFNYNGLPEKGAFYSRLRLEGVSDEDYKHALNVYDKLECKSFVDYHMAYLKSDVNLLADIFENFRKLSLKNYELDPLNYISAPSLAWDAMLLKTDITLDLISDVKMLEMIERHKRGGLCFVGSKRHCVANNPYMSEYDENTPDNYIMYWDANNLYGWAMSEPLPYKDLKFDSDVTLDTILNTDDNNETGYILEVDLHFPEDIHDKLKEFPVCPENINVKQEWLSEFQEKLMKDLNVKTVDCNKLVPHLYDHKNYVIHYRNLKFVKNLGVEIGHVHNVISFKQKQWLETYISFNTECRKKAKDEFEKDFFKLMNNAVFGKTMENVRNRIKMHLTNDDDNAVKWFSKVNFKSASHVDGVYFIQMNNEEVEMNKPIYVGTSILDLSKVCMMNFHYNVINETFKDNYSVLYSDTDSLVYEFRGVDIYKWMNQNKQHFDLSDIGNPHTKFLKDSTNKKRLGCMKDENNGFIVKEFLALNPKVYSFIHDKWDDNKHKLIENYNSKKLKGINKAVVKKQISHNDFRTTLETNTIIKREVTRIASINHNVYTYQQTKNALTSFYDKMYMIDCINCVPHGYKQTCDI